MADDSVMIASAVIIPEAAQETLTSTGATKRRQSSISDSHGQDKRPRLSVESEHRQSSQTSPSTAEPATPATPTTGDPQVQNDTGRRQSRGGAEHGKEEERKRGKRLFGSLLGTLSQSSSSSTKQRRRADIDKKQQEKLKLRAEEYDEQQKRHLDELMAARNKEQKIWDQESLHLKHANMLAMANFLKTETEPVLYFKPWELTSRDRDIIRAQVTETEKQIVQELEEHDENTTGLPGLDRAQLDGATEAPDAENSQVSRTAVEYAEPRADDGVAPADKLTTSRNENTDADENPTGPAEDETAKDLAEDNEEVVVEAGEDAVLW